MGHSVVRPVPGAAPLDRAKVEALSLELFKPVRAHYLADAKPSRDKTLEILNALAVVVATCLAGTGYDIAALDFYEDALDMQIKDLKANPPVPRAKADATP